MPIAWAETPHSAQWSIGIAASWEPPAGLASVAAAEQISVNGFADRCALSACDTDGASASPSIANSASQVNLRR